MNTFVTLSILVLLFVFFANVNHQSDDLFHNVGITICAGGYHWLRLAHLKRRQLSEQIALRAAWLSRGFLVWETTVQLALRVLHYSLLSLLLIFLRENSD